MRLLPLLLLSLAALAADWTPSPEEARVVERLAPRHGAPDCAALEAALPHPAAALARIAEHVDFPPWVGIRAATCLAARDDADDTLSRWLVAPELAGLADVVLTSLDTLPPERADRLARVALSGPLAARAGQALSRSQQPALRALVVPK